MPLDLDAFSIPAHFQGFLSTIGILDVIDILVVALIIYKIYQMLENTRAISLVKGLLVLLAFQVVCDLLELHLMTWLLQKVVTLLFVALPIVFQPELRRTLEHIGQGTFFERSALLDDAEAVNVVNHLIRAAKQLSKDKTGALIVIEREMGLNDICATGIPIHGLITAEFLLNVFIVNTPLHDGAAVIRGNRLVAAGCLLPLTENRNLSTELGTRHRAAIGISEQCDALIMVVSEETGTISIAEDGHIIRHLDEAQLRAKLMPCFSKEKPKTGLMELWKKWRNRR